MILLDSSSSMTDLSKEVALTILDTLGQDDFVTVLAFSDKARLIPECVENLYAEYGPVKVQVQVGHLSALDYHSILYTSGYSQQYIGAERGCGWNQFQFQPHPVSAGINFNSVLYTSGYSQ